MKLINFTYESKKHIENQVLVNDFKQEKLLIFLFSDEPVEKIKNIIKEIRDLLPKALLIGSTSAGSIINNSSVDNTSLITLCHFENINPLGLELSIDTYHVREMAVAIKEKIINDDTKMLFLFSSGQKIHTHLLLEDLSSVAQGIPLAGGKAGYADNYESENTFVFLNDRIVKEGLVAVTLNGPFLRIEQMYRLNWKKIGKKMKITDGKENVIKSMDGINIIDIYKKYMGEEFAENLPDSAGLEFPFILNRNGIDIARSVVNKLPDGSITYHGDVKIGEEVTFGYGHIPLILEALEKDCEKAASFNPEGILVFSCIARKNLLQKAVNYEIQPFAKISPLSGFFTLGEFFHSKGSNFLLNATMTMVLLSENPMIETDQFNDLFFDVKFERKDRQLNIIKNLIYLVDSVSKELEETNIELKERNKLLKHISKTDSLTGLYNHGHFKETLELEVSRSIRYGNELSVAIIDFDDFKSINDEYGHVIGDKVLNRVANKIKENCRETDIVCRYGGDEIVIILPETDMEKAVEVIERIRCEIAAMTFENKKINITISTGVAKLDPLKPHNLLKKADERMYKAKKIGKNSIICKG